MAEELNTETPEPPAPDVVVQLEPEASPNILKVEAPAKTDPVKDLADQYKELEAKAETDRAERDAALQRATEAEQAAANARQEAASAHAAATDSNLSTITTALQSAQAAVDAAKRDKRIAREQGDFDAESDADDRLIQARIDVRTYDEAKANLESRKSAPPQQQQRRQAAPQDVVEAYVANRSEPTAKWLREHRDFILDGRKNQKLTAAHHDAVAEGLTPDTKEYFAHVETFVGLTKKDEKPVTQGDDVQRPGAKKQQQRAVAPVNGASGSGGAVNNNTVTLSQREATAAQDGTHVWNYDDPSGQKKFKKGDAIGIEEFARRKQKMSQQGLYDKAYVDQ